MYHNGEWGTVCDDNWELDDAKVVCNELGFGRAVDVKHFAYYGQGSGPIWLGVLDCDGTELTIGDCPNLGWGEHNCDDSEDAGVKCHPLGKSIF